MPKCQQRGLSLLQRKNGATSASRPSQPNMPLLVLPINRGRSSPSAANWLNRGRRSLGCYSTLMIFSLERTMSAFPKRIAVLGSTGSIGQQTLDVVRCFPDQFELVALAARSNVALLAQQVQEFRPSLVACFADTPEVKEKIRHLLP